MNYEDFVASEYALYLRTTDDPMEYDDWFVGSDYLESLYKELV